MTFLIAFFYAILKNKILFLVNPTFRELTANYKIPLICSILSLAFACNKRQDNNQQVKDKVAVFFKQADAGSLTGQQREKVLDSAYAYLETGVNDSVHRNFLFNLAARYEDIGSEDKYLEVCQIVYSEAKQMKDSGHIAQALYWIGDHYESNTQTDSAFKYYIQAEKIYKHMGDTLNYGRAVLYKAGILYDSGNFPESINQGIIALKLLKGTNDARLVFESYVNIALSLKEVNNYEKALDYFNLALIELDKLDRQPGYPDEKVQNSRASCFNNIGTIYERLHEYSKAIQFYNQGLNADNLFKERPKLYATLLSNLAYAKMKSGDDRNVKNLLFRSLKIRDSLEILPGIIASKFKIGEYYLYQKDTASALQYFRDGYELSRKAKTSAEILQSLQLLTENDTKNKAYYSRLYFKVNDSIQNVERATQNKFARIAYETEQIEEENQLLSRRNKIVIAVSLILFFAGLAAFVIFRLRAKNKELLYLKEQQETNEKIYQLMLNQQSETEAARNEERNRIAMELHDGIVNSVFTTRFNLMQLESGAEEKKQELVQELEKTENEIRRVSHDLQQNLFFEDKSLPEILANLVASQQNNFNTAFDLSVDKYIDWSVVSGADKIHIYRIVQEAIQNVNKYSKAERCLIMLLKTGEKITIRIWDNGVGFNTEKAREGIGLKNIRTRTDALDGQLKIISGQGKGTTIEVVF